MVAGATWLQVRHALPGTTLVPQLVDFAPRHDLRVSTLVQPFLLRSAAQRNWTASREANDLPHDLGSRNRKECRFVPGTVPGTGTVQYRAPPSLLKPRREPSARTSFVPRVPPCAGCCSVAQSQLIDRARRHCCHLPQRRCWTASKDGSAAIAATVACDTLTGSSRLCHDIVCVGAAAGNFGPAS